MAAPQPTVRSPRIRRELRYCGLLGGFGLLVLPFLVYLAGVLSLGPYDGGLPSFLRSLYGAILEPAPGAWLLVGGPYLLFWAVRLVSRPLRRPAARD